jgi:Ca2+-binding RTX toxin-like protein
MVSTVFANYNGTGRGGTLDPYTDGLVPVGVSIISTDSYGIIGDSSHKLHVFGNVFGDYYGISLGFFKNVLNESFILFEGGSVNSTNIALGIFGSKNSVVNYGQIFGESWGIDCITSAENGQLQIRNYGDISSSDVSIENRGELTLSIKNFGRIDADEGVAIKSAATLAGEIYNTGLILGSISLGVGADAVYNQGSISGDVFLSDGQNFFDNRGGTVSGTVTFGVDNDTFRPGAGPETVVGGAGADTLDFTLAGSVQIALDGSIANSGFAKDDDYTDFENITGSKSGKDTLIGDGNANVLDGLGGADKLFGQAGADTLYGSRGNDTLDGGADGDTLSGDDGNDTLLGGLGVDALLGGIGDDRLAGGADNDAMTGGMGADRFVFLAKDFLGINQNTPDRIFDFRPVDRDLIDLSLIDASTKTTGNQAFTLIGTGPFHSIAGELRFQQVSGNTYLFGDTNGDGVSDFTIMLDGLLTPTAKDFVL